MKKNYLDIINFTLKQGLQAINNCRHTYNNHPEDTDKYISMIMGEIMNTYQRLSVIKYNKVKEDLESLQVTFIEKEKK